MLTHIKSNDKYNIYVLYTNLDEKHKNNILSLEQPNLRITFIDVTQKTTKYNDIFSVNAHFTIEVYYRFFLPQLFPNFDKVLYLDSDILINADIAPLFNIDIGNNYLGVTHDCGAVDMVNAGNTKFAKYVDQTLGVNVKNYFQSGVMLVNLKQMRKDNITQKLLIALERIKTPLLPDQDILNMVCRNNIQYIPQKWNYTWHLPFVDDDYLKHIGGALARQYQKAQLNPCIIHFTGNGMKPINYPLAAEARLFWNYAKNTPYYNELKNKMNVCYDKAKREVRSIEKKIKKYKLLNIMTLGFQSKKYKKKIKKKQLKLKNIKKYILNQY